MMRQDEQKTAEILRRVLYRTLLQHQRAMQELEDASRRANPMRPRCQEGYIRLSALLGGIRAVLLILDGDALSAAEVTALWREVEKLIDRYQQWQEEVLDAYRAIAH
jgi:hypothetical protein